MAAGSYFLAGIVCGGIANLQSMPTPVLIFGCVVLVAITAFWPSRPARSIYR
jgi:hypothetical protein